MILNRKQFLDSLDKNPLSTVKLFLADTSFSQTDPIQMQKNLIDIFSVCAMLLAKQLNKKSHKKKKLGKTLIHAKK